MHSFNNHQLAESLTTTANKQQHTGNLRTVPEHYRTHIPLEGQHGRDQGDEEGLGPVHLEIMTGSL
jgi:hypothetical protein